MGLTPQPSVNNVKKTALFVRGAFPNPVSFIIGKDVHVNVKGSEKFRQKLSM